MVLVLVLAGQIPRDFLCLVGPAQDQNQDQDQDQDPDQDQNQDQDQDQNQDQDQDQDQEPRWTMLREFWAGHNAFSGELPWPTA